MNRITRLTSAVCLTMFITTIGLQAGEIHTAAMGGDLKKVRALIEANPTLLESQDDNGFTPLHTACYAKQVAVANFLVDRGANINVRDKYQFTPLHRACYLPDQDLALIRRLMEKGADVNSQGTNGLTPLHWAARSGDLNVARLLLAHGADPNASDKYSGTIKSSSISGTILQVAINFGPKEEMAKLLVEGGAKLNRRDSSGNTELHLAALKGYADVTRLLIGHGADVNAVNEYNRTALYYAAKHGYRGAADVLIAAGAERSAIVEANYGKAPQLAARLKEGEAYLWYLGDGYAVKTREHLLLFNPEDIDESLEAGLANGHLNPSELAGLKITVLATLSERFQYGPEAFKLAKRMLGVDLVFGVKPVASGAGDPDLPSYRLAGPNQSFSVGGIHVHTIPATGGGMGYLVEADGVKIFNAGFHVSGNVASLVDKYRKEIDFLKPFGPIDVAILSVHSHSNSIDAACEPYLYLLDLLSPEAVYLTGANLPEQYPKCAGVLRARNIPVSYPEGGRAKGERFHYLRSQARDGQLPEPTAGANIPQRALDVTYIANEGFLIRAAGKKVLTDAPIVAPPSETLKAMTDAREPFNDLDLILVTHRHADHFDPASLIACLRSNPKARLVAPTEAVDLMRSIDGFASVVSQIQEIKGDAGAHERVSHNGIAVDVLCLNHEHSHQARNLAFVVELGGARFLHMGDAFVNENEAHLNSYPFEQAPIDFVFVNQYDRSQATRQFIARKIKPSRIVAMHISPAEWAEESKKPKIRAAYPYAIVFKQTMERRSLPIEIDFHNLSGAYFGQTPPGATPRVFARGIVSTDDLEHSSPAFSPDGSEVYWRENRRPGPDNEEGFGFNMTMRRENGRWSAPYVTPNGLFVFSADGRTAYFSSARPRSGAAEVTQPDLDIWFVERHGDDWSDPKCLNLVARYPELRWAGVRTIARNGTLYFMGYTPGPLNDAGIYRAELVDGEYAKPQLLPRGINLPPFLNWTPFIALDESCLLFSSNRRDPSRDAGDLYISRRLADGNWTEPVSLGEPVNSDRQERSPMVSPDGKYLFFTRPTPGHDQDVYWVDLATVPALRQAPDSGGKSIWTNNLK